MAGLCTYSIAKSETCKPEVERSHHRHNLRHGAHALLKPLDNLRTNADPGSQRALRPSTQSPRFTHIID